MDNTNQDKGPDLPVRPERSLMFEREVLTNPLMRGEESERLYKRRILIAPEADGGREVYLGFVRLPKDEEEAKLLNMDMGQFGLEAHSLFLDPQVAIDMGLSLIMSGQALLMEAEPKAEYTLVVLLSITLPQGGDPERIAPALHKSLGQALPRNSQLDIKIFSKDGAI